MQDDLDVEIIGEVLWAAGDAPEAFLGRLEALLEDNVAFLRQAWDDPAPDAATVADAAHRLKGAAGALGMSRLAAECRALEADLRSSRVADCASRMEAVLAALAPALRALATFRAERLRVPTGG